MNVAPSAVSLTATTVARFTSSPAASSANQIVWFPGHLTNSGGMHPSFTTSNYAEVNVTGVPTQYVSGPVQVGSVPALAAVHTVGITVGGSSGSASTSLLTNAGVSGVATPVLWDSSTGLSAPVATDYWHRPVSCSIRITNTTPAGNVSGSVTTVVPGATFDVVAATPAQEAWAIFPTYNINDAAGTVEVVWVPRATDLGYWGYAGSGLNSNLRDAGIIIWLNSASTSQSYTVEIVCNWEIAGSAYRTLAGPTEVSDHAGDAVKQMVAQVHAGSVSAGKMLNAGMHFAEKIMGYVPMAARAATRIMGAQSG